MPCRVKIKVKLIAINFHKEKNILYFEKKYVYIVYMLGSIAKTKCELPLKA